MVAQNRMNVGLFTVSDFDRNTQLESALASIQRMPLENRMKEVYRGFHMRLETIMEPNEERPYWLLDFVRLRYDHGPGRASSHAPIAGFDLAPDDGFGEETAMLYVPQSKHLFIQYNHHGTKQGALVSYLAMVNPDRVYGFEISPSLDPAVEAKLLRSDRFSRFEMSIAPGLLSAEMRNEGVAVAQALRATDGFSAPHVTVTLSVGHSKASLATAAVRDAINFVRRAVNAHDGAVSSASVIGKSVDDVDAKAEVLDLIAPRKKWEFTDLELGLDRRYTQQSRFRALERAYMGWRGGNN